jgi:excisionase family DNA binding protein
MGRAATDRIHLTISAPKPAGSARANVERQRRSAWRVAELVEHLLERVPANDLAEALTQVGEALTRPHQAGAGATLARQLADGREYSSEERRALEVDAQLRAFRFRQELLGDALTAPQVARLLGVSRQTPHDRARRGELLAVMDRGQWRFPRWQFDPETPGGVLPGLADVSRVLRVSPLAKVSWFVSANPYLEGSTPLEALRRGETERVVDVAAAVGLS